jgi:hypothetical protein
MRRLPQQATIAGFRAQNADKPEQGILAGVFSMLRDVLFGGADELLRQVLTDVPVARRFSLPFGPQ